MPANFSRRSWIAGTSAALLAVAAAVGLRLGIALAQDGDPMPPITVTAVPIVHFDKADAARVRFGSLEWRGGMVLSADGWNFGGWSGLIVDPAGQKLVAVSDRLQWLRADIAYEAERPVGLANAFLGELRPTDIDVKGLRHDRDAEAIALVEGTIDKGEVLIAFERKSRLVKLDLDGSALSAPKEYLTAPPEAAEISDNAGFEAATMIRGGALAGAIVAIAEDFRDGAGNHSGWIWENGEPKRFSLASVDDFAISDIASLDDGGLIVLERRASLISGFAMRLRHVKPGGIRPGAVVNSELLMEAASGTEIDNMEALAIHRNSRGETILTLMSDNNFSYFLQRTLLLQFAVKAGIATAQEP